MVVWTKFGPKFGSGHIQSEQNHKYWEFGVWKKISCSNVASTLIFGGLGLRYVAHCESTLKLASQFPGLPILGKIAICPTFIPISHYDFTTGTPHSI